MRQRLAGDGALRPRPCRQTLVVSGVRFMGETAKILSPGEAGADARPGRDLFARPRLPGRRLRPLLRAHPDRHGGGRDGRRRRRAKSSAGQPRSSEQVASRSGISTRLSGRQDLGGLAHEAHAGDDQRLRRHGRGRSAPSRASRRRSRRSPRPGPAGRRRRSSARPARRRAPCSRRRMRVLERLALGRPAARPARGPRHGACRRLLPAGGQRLLVVDVDDRDTRSWLRPPSNRIEKSIAFTSLVRAPIEMRSTPVSARARTLVEVTPPEISSMARRAGVDAPTASRSVGRSMLSSSTMRRRRAASASSQLRQRLDLDLRRTSPGSRRAPRPAAPRRRRRPRRCGSP